MFVPVPVLILGAVAAFALIAWALSRGHDRRDDLIGPPPSTEAPFRHGQDGMAGGTMALPVAAPSGAAVELNDDLRDEVWKLVHTGHVINAVKLVREKTGLGLKESKDLVDNLRRDDVTLR